ncbi:hypothetical protein GH714_042785 [Hevea brasiliensis]|uniref:Radical SAM core domain-containing protein n=1 Tax=Hevea brasiliensis TaxID=3981 RepID=A0A6A6JZE7_HEVBR|nr:hypothetical protein GH714_042785 [Hevea brasiliensis]
MENKPDWLRVRMPGGAVFKEVAELVRHYGLNTGRPSRWGASHFAKCVREIRKRDSSVTVEILTPDFLGKPCAIDIIASARPDVYNHNLETVPRLYSKVRPRAKYFNSLNLLKEVKDRSPGVFTKSGFMLGLGESKEEVYQVMDDLRCAGVDFIVMGQYLQPTKNNIEVHRYVPLRSSSSTNSWRMRRGSPWLLQVRLRDLPTTLRMTSENLRNLGSHVLK